VTHYFTTAQSLDVAFHGLQVEPGGPRLDVDLLPEPRLVSAIERYRHRNGRVRLEPFYYALNFDSLSGRAVMGTETVTVTVTDHDFLACYLYASLDDPQDGSVWSLEDPFFDNAYLTSGVPAGSAIPNTLVNLRLELGDVRLDSQPVPLGSRFGIGKAPGRFPSPLLLERGQSLTALVAFNDASSGTNLPLRCYLTVGGVRLVKT
jgi:hypothetical protein